MFKQNQGVRLVDFHRGLVLPHLKRGAPLSPRFSLRLGTYFMDVQIVIFPETKVAAIEHFGSPVSEHGTARKLIAWKVENRFLAETTLGRRPSVVYRLRRWG